MTETWLYSARPRRTLIPRYCRRVDTTHEGRAQTDAELVVRIRDGDESAWAPLVERYADLVFRVARAACDDDHTANDATQGTWLKFLENAERISDPAAVRGWLATTARREAIALNKRLSRQRPEARAATLHDAEARRGTGTNGAIPDPPVDPAVLVAGRDEIRILLEEMSHLSEKCRTLLTLHAQKVSYAEIARVLDIQPGGVGPSKGRCLDELRRSPRVAQLWEERNVHD